MAASYLDITRRRYRVRHGMASSFARCSSVNLKMEKGRVRFPDRPLRLRQVDTVLNIVAGLHAGHRRRRHSRGYREVVEPGPDRARLYSRTTR